MKNCFLHLTLGLIVFYNLSCNGPAATPATTVTSDSAAPATADTVGWALLPFTKADSVNPVLTPGTGTFNDPVSKKKLNWEEKDVFNPAIVVKDNKVYMLYRAQDKVGR